MSRVKGLSPLIATVVFIAFIVSFIALFASWMFTQVTAEGKCEKAEMSDVRVCIDRQESLLRMAVTNSGRAPLAGFSVNITEGGVSSQNEIAEALGRGVAGEYSVDYAALKTSPTGVTIIPHLADGKKTIPCAGPAVSVPGGDITEC